MIQIYPFCRFRVTECVSDLYQVTCYQVEEKLISLTAHFWLSATKSPHFMNGMVADFEKFKFMEFSFD